MIYMALNLDFQSHIDHAVEFILKIQVNTLAYDVSYVWFWTLFCQHYFDVDFKIRVLSKCATHNYLCERRSDLS